MSDSFCDSAMSPEFKTIPAGYKGTGGGVYDGDPCAAFGEYRRTPSPNAVPERIFDGNVGKPSGESDMF